LKIPPEKQKARELWKSFPGLLSAVSGSCATAHTTTIDAPRDRPEKAPAGQHEQRQQRTTFMPAQLSVKSAALVNQGP
jgi:hypothetical protein